MTQLLEPPQSEHGTPFWDATRDERLVLPYSVATGAPFWYPREVPPDTLMGPGEDTIEWREARGDGVVYAVSVQHKPGPGRDPAEGPYAVALVDLPEGVRVMTNVVGCEPHEVAVGMAVRVTWHELSDGRKLPMFRPAQVERNTAGERVLGLAEEPGHDQEAGR